VAQLDTGLRDKVCDIYSRFDFVNGGHADEL
jgi:hypothetical protein